MDKMLVMLPSKTLLLKYLFFCSDSFYVMILKMLSSYYKKYCTAPCSQKVCTHFQHHSIKGVPNKSTNRKSNTNKLVKMGDGGGYIIFIDSVKGLATVDRLGSS